MNTVLAFQLLQSGHAFKDNYAKSTEIYALEQGLRMMKTVLNDVLDFEKMDCGHFETIGRPFPLHHSIRAILDQVEIQTGARQLVLERSLDEGIDRIPRLTAGAADEPEGLWVLGSELRLHQVLTNLAANAIKYTPERGGFIRIATEFLGIFTREELPDNPPDLEQRHDKNQRWMENPNNTFITVETQTNGNGNGAPPPPRDGSAGATVQTCLKFRLEVQDSGPGIKPSDLVEDRLFQPFFQTAVGQLSGSGTGLGLAIVKQIVKLSGGRLGVTSRRGEGSKFWSELSYPLASAAEIQAARDTNTLKFPRETGKPSSQATDATLEFATEAAASSPPAVTLPCSPMPRYECNADDDVQSELEQRSLPLQSAVTAVSSSDPLRVLVVDDDAVTRVLSSKLLTKLGCIVQTATDGRECVDMVLGSDPYNYDLICLDNFMPVMTGQEAVKELRANKRLDFIVGCTGNALTEDQASYREAGADEIIVKPVMIHDFKRLIQLAHQRRLERRAQALTVPP